MLVFQLLQEMSAVVQLLTLQAKVTQQLLQEGAVLCLTGKQNETKHQQQENNCVASWGGYWRKGLDSLKLRGGTGGRASAVLS